MTHSYTFKILLLAAALGLSAASGSAQISEATVEVDGMSCPFCAYGLEKKMAKLPGVDSVEVDLATGTARVTAAVGASIALSEIPEAVRQAGFTAGDVEVVALGRVTQQADGGWRMDLADSGEEILLVNLSPELADRVSGFAGSAAQVRVAGKAHLHTEAATGIEPRAIEVIQGSGSEDRGGDRVNS